MTIHIEAEGDYGFALPSNIEMFILSSGGSHEGHDHGSHGDSHGGHSDSHGDSNSGTDDGGTDQATSESEIDAGEGEDDFNMTRTAGSTHFRSRLKSTLFWLR